MGEGEMPRDAAATLGGLARSVDVFIFCFVNVVVVVEGRPAIMASLVHAWSNECCTGVGTVLERTRGITAWLAGVGKELPPDPPLLSGPS
mmetsp:Transcript_116472/g.340760  ORF Transcript_116472/g.340760 Transcript_116472/m.340760 type:complete len:90 (-) Transcript_116472:157-426(-)